MNTQTTEFTQTSILALAAVVLTCLLSGCATTHGFKVDALSRDVVMPAPTSYQLVNATGGVHEATAPFDLVANEIRTGLAGQGVFEAPSKTNPSVIVTVEYGFRQPRKVLRADREIFLVPSTSHASSSNIGGGSSGVRGPAGFGPGGSLQFQHRVVQSSETIVPKFLRLTAHSASADDQQRQLWYVEVRDESASTDLGRILPEMTAVAMEHIIINSKTRQPVTVAASDNGVHSVGRGL